MRISLRECDPGYINDERYSVLLNGRMVRAPLTADDVKGIVEEAMLTRAGYVRAGPSGELISTWKRGKVEIIHHPSTLRPS